MNIKLINQQNIHLKIRLQPRLNYVTVTFLIEHIIKMIKCFNSKIN